MARSPRVDYPGALHHVWNRGIASRPVFEDEEQMCRFLDLLSDAVDRKLIQVIAFVCLTTHFHLFVRSPLARLSDALKRIEGRYVQWFNQRHGRDGALFGGRFRSKVVESELYGMTLVRYVDLNPVVAGMVTRPEDYPWGSAHLYLRGGDSSWLDRAWLDEMLADLTGQGMSWAAAYRYRFGAPLDDDVMHIVERRMSQASWGDSFADLILGAPDAIRVWFAERARLADGVPPGPAFLGAKAVLRAVRERADDWTLGEGKAAVNGWAVVESALLRETCALSLTEIARTLGVHRRTVARRLERHRSSATTNEDYAARLASALQAAVDLHLVTFGVRPPM